MEISLCIVVIIVLIVMIIIQAKQIEDLREKIYIMKLSEQIVNDIIEETDRYGTR